MDDLYLDALALERGRSIGRMTVCHSFKTSPLGRPVVPEVCVAGDGACGVVDGRGVLVGLLCQPISTMTSFCLFILFRTLASLVFLL